MPIKAEIVYPALMREKLDSGMPQGWVSEGMNAKVADKYSALFPSYSSSASYASMALPDGTSVLASPSEFADGSASAQWLISAPIEFQHDEEMLMFDIYAYGNAASNSYRILLSEGGSAKEDFTETVSSGTVKGAGADAWQSASKRVVLTGEKGKTYRVAFVNYGNSTGLMAFGNVMMMPYYMDITDGAQYNLLGATMDTQYKMSIKLTAATPYGVPGVTAVLTTDTGISSTVKTTKNILLSPASNITLDFPDLIPISQEAITYTVTITPNMDEVDATVISGTIVAGQYPSTVFFEEGTGTWCSYCPRGYAFMNYYQDKYNKPEQRQRVIVSAVHARDPMQVDGVLNGFKKVSEALGVSGYPSAVANRTLAADPSAFNIDSLLSQTTYADIRIQQLKYNAEARQIEVTCNAETCFDSAEGNFNISFLFTQDHMQGEGSKWAQVNSYSVYTEAQIAALYGEEMLPFWRIFVGTTNPVPATDITYPDVARAVWPSYEGIPVEGAWMKHEARTLSYTIDIPEEVTSIDDANLIVLLTAPGSGKVITADRAEISGEAGIGEVFESDSDTAPVYYDLMGMRLNTPTSRSIVIERRGSHSRLLLIP